MADMNLSRMKVDIISGFLGAGKTTLIQTLIRQGIYLDNKLMVLENEFGKVNIDGRLLKQSDVELESIVSSCICCSGALALQDKLMDIAACMDTRHLLIEPSGVARLSDVKRIFHFPKVKERYQLNKIITVVDALNYANWLRVSKGLFEDQIRFSDILYISKFNCSGQNEQQALYDVLKKIRPDCPIFADAEALLVYLKKNAEQETKNADSFFLALAQVKNNFDTYSFVQEAALKITRFEQFLGEMKTGAYGNIYRMKGIFQDEEQNWYSIESVSYEYQIIGFKSDSNIRIELSFIGKGIDTDALERALHSCLA